MSRAAGPTPVEREADVGGRHVDGRQRAIQQDETRAGRKRRQHGAVSAGLGAEQR
jgi:hypothetical protein